MFEKESKEYVNKWLEHVKDLELYHKSDDKPEYIRILEAHQSGAEFGYNKANEWHKVLDGDLPKDSEVKLCYTRTAKYVCASYDEKYDCWGFVFNNLEHCIPSSVIIAWKEIVPPKEIE